MFEVGSVVSVGSYGVILKGKCNDTGKLKAIKCNIKEKNADGIGNIREASMLNKYKHNHIVNMEKYIIENDTIKILGDNGTELFIEEYEKLKREWPNTLMDNIYMVMEYANNDFSRCLALRIANKFDDNNMDLMLVHILLALEYLHNNNIVHLDVKPNNILEFNEGNEKPIYKLCDMGMAINIDKRSIVPSDICTQPYKSPELLLNNICDSQKDYTKFNGTIDLKKVDIWALGVIWAEYIYNHNPFYDNKFYLMNTEDDINVLYNILGLANEEEIILYKNMNDVIMKYYDRLYVHKTETATINNDYSKFPKLLRNMLTVDPNRRYGATQCLNDDYFDKYREYINSVRNKYSNINYTKFIKSKLNLTLETLDNETFTAERLFNEFVSLIDHNKYDNDDIIILRYTCWYIMHKYYSVMINIIKFPVDIISQIVTKYNSDQIMEIMLKMELEILDKFELNVYRMNPSNYIEDSDITSFYYYIHLTNPGTYNIEDIVTGFNKLSAEEKRNIIRNNGDIIQKPIN